MTTKRENEVSQERRSSGREGTDLEVHFCIVSGENGRKSKEIPGSIKNLSEEGFCLTTDLTMVDEFHVLTGRSGISENTLEIRIHFPGEREILILGAACWYNLAGSLEPYRYLVGVRIPNAPEDYLSFLKKYLRQARKGRFRRTLLSMKWLERLLRSSRDS